MEFWQELREIAVTFIGDDDGGARLGDEKIGARNANVRCQEFLAQDLARFGDEVCGLVENAALRKLRVRLAEAPFDFSDGQMNGRRDDVARRFVLKLNEIFAKIGFDDFKPCLFEMIVEVDFLRHHGLALGDEARIGRAADIEDDRARVFRRCGPMHFGARGRCIFLIDVEVVVEVREGVILDVAGEDVAQAIQLAVEYAPAPPFDSGRPETAPARVLARVQRIYGQGMPERLAAAEKAGALV